MISPSFQQNHGEFIAIMVQIICSAHNNRIFNSTYTFPSQIYYKALTYFSKISTPSLRYYGSYSSSHHQPSHLVSQLPPPSGTIKINFDGFVKSSIATAAYVICDYHSFFIQARDKLLHMLWYPLWSCCGVDSCLARPVYSYP